MTNDTQPQATNPAFKLYDLVKPWRVTPQGISPISHREASSGGRGYAELLVEAMQLLKEVELYLDERAQASGGRGQSRTSFTNILRGVAGTGHWPLGEVSRNETIHWTAEDMEWLDTLGASWNRVTLMPPADDIKEVFMLAGLIENHLSTVEDIDDTDRQYLLDLCDGLRKMIREVHIYGSAPTARLATELIGALKVYVPSSDTEAEAFSVRLSKALHAFTVYFVAPTLAQLAGTAIMPVLAIEPPKE